MKQLSALFIALLSLPYTICNHACIIRTVATCISTCIFFLQKSQSNGPDKEKDGVIQNFKRTLSKKEKKKEKKREKEFPRIPDGDEQALTREDG